MILFGDIYHNPFLGSGFEIAAVNVGLTFLFLVLFTLTLVFLDWWCFCFLVVLAVGFDITVSVLPFQSWFCLGYISKPDFRRYCQNHGR